MPIARRALFLSLGAFVLLSASGCSYTFAYDLEVQVVNAADGTPIPDATVTLEWPYGNLTAEAQAGPDLGLYKRQVTKEYIGSEEKWPGERWQVKVSRAKFVTQVVDVKPRTQPKWGSLTRLRATVRLEPVQSR